MLRRVYAAVKTAAISGSLAPPTLDITRLTPSPRGRRARSCAGSLPLRATVSGWTQYSCTTYLRRSPLLQPPPVLLGAVVKRRRGRCRGPWCLAWMERRGRPEVGGSPVATILRDEEAGLFSRWPTPGGISEVPVVGGRVAVLASGDGVTVLSAARGSGKGLQGRAPDALAGDGGVGRDRIPIASG